MEGYQNATYGERIADVYDAHVARTRGATNGDAAADYLSTLAPEGTMLELGIGTGRVALPLVARGVTVHGIDASAAMVEQLRVKPGGDTITVAIGEMADVRGPASEYDVVFVVFNTFFALLSQREQVRAFTNVECALRPGGRFVLEAFVPDVARFVNGKHSQVVTIGVDEVYFDVSTFDALTQRVDANHIRLRNGQPVEMWPVSMRFAWPSELDLMAELAGLEPEARYSGWQGEPFTAQSANHVSVWSKPSR